MATRLPVRVVMGGLRPGTDTPMTDEAKNEHRRPLGPRPRGLGPAVRRRRAGARGLHLRHRPGRPRRGGRAARGRGSGRPLPDGRPAGLLRREPRRHLRPRCWPTSPPSSAWIARAFLAAWASEEAKAGDLARLRHLAARRGHGLSRPWSAARTTRASTAWSPAATRPASRCWPCCATGSPASPPERRRPRVALMPPRCRLAPGVAGTRYREERGVAVRPIQKDFHARSRDHRPWPRADGRRADQPG